MAKTKEWHYCKGAFRIPRSTDYDKRWLQRHANHTKEAQARVLLYIRGTRVLYYPMIVPLAQIDKYGKTGWEFRRVVEHVARPEVSR